MLKELTVLARLECREQDGAWRWGERGVAAQGHSAKALQVVIKVPSNRNDFEMTPVSSLCDVFLLKSSKLSSI